MSEEVVKKPSLMQKWKDRKNKPKSKARVIIEWILLSIFGVVFVFILAGNISGMVNKKANYGQSIRFGVGTFVVLTDSMEPDYAVNSTIITYKEDVNKIYDKYVSDPNAVIDVTFMNEYVGITLEDSDLITEEFKSYNGGVAVVSNAIMTHRIREIHVDNSKEIGKGHYIFVTSGINTGGVAAKAGQYQVFTEKQYLGTVKYNSAFIGKVFSFVSSPIGLIVLLLIPAFYLIAASAVDIYRAVKDDDDGGEGGSGGGTSSTSELSEKDKERLKQELLQEMMEKKMGEKKDA